MNLGVYISTQNEENLITLCIKSIQRVFPQVELIDLGSEDRTVERARKTEIPIHRVGQIHGEEYPHLKNHFCRKDDWVFWIDSDEIYPMESLLKIKKRLEKPTHSTINVHWRVLKIEDEEILTTIDHERLCGNGKLYDTKTHFCRRAWPKEVLACSFHHKKDHKREDCTKELRGLNGIYCWHAVLLNRSQIELTGRRKKRVSKLTDYGMQYEWKKIPKFPWDEDIPELMKQL